MDPVSVRNVEVAVVGAGQAGLATAFYLRRAGLAPGRDFVIVDAAERPGGAWPRTWDGLRLFSPASFSSLPGWMMPPWDDATRGFPPRDHVVDYLTRYEERYDLQVLRPHRVISVRRADDDPAVVGGGNSAAQILAEVSTMAETTWLTAREPRFLADDIDGRALFATARARIKALEEGRDHAGVAGLGDIVMVASVKDARDRGVLRAEPMVTRLTPDGIAWANGTSRSCDVVIWCTGFRPALRHLRPLGLRTSHGRIPVGGATGTQALDEPRLRLVGYGTGRGPHQPPSPGSARGPGQQRTPSCTPETGEE